MGAVDRMALHAYLSHEAHDAWERFAEENGVSITGILEALGLEIGEELEKNEAIDVRQDLVRKGRKVDAARRKRSKSPAVA